MSKISKKLLCALLVASMASSFAGCQSGGTPPADSSSGDSNATTPDAVDTTPVVIERSGDVNKYGWDKPVNTIEFTYYTGDQEPGDYEEAIFDYLKDEFNVVINKITYKQDMTERLNLMLSSDDYPDVISNMPDTMANQFAEQGRAVELSNLMPEYAPNYTDELGNYLNLMKNDAGELYKLPFNWGHTTDGKGRDFGIRYDWWQETGLPIYDSFEGFYEVCKAILEKHPTSPAGDKTYAITASNQGKEWFETPLAYLGFKSGFKVADDGSLTHWVDTDEGLEIAKYINRFYREGMIDPDWQNNTYDDAIAKMSSERIVGNIGTWWHLYVAGHETWMNTEGDNYDVNKRFVNVPFQQGDETPTLISDNYVRTERNIITDKATNVEEILTWMDFETTPIGRCLIGSGVPNETNIWDFDGETITFTDSYLYSGDINKDFHEPRELNGAGNAWVAAPGYRPETNDDFSSFNNDLLQSVHMWGFVLDETKLDTSRFSEATQKEKELNATYERPDFKWDASLYTITFPADSQEAILKITIDENIASEWAKVVTADSEEACEAAFLSMRDTLNVLGLAQLTEYSQEVVQGNLAKFEG